MQSITVTFPKNIPVDKVVFIMEGNMKANSDYPCQCQFKEFDGEENVFLIWSNCNEAFYFIGITAAQIITKYS